MTQPTLLIDADLLLYRSAAACEHSIQWDDECWVLHGNLEEAKDIFRQSLDGITNALGTGEHVLCFSDRENFRKLVSPTYKSKRKDTRKPLVFQPLMQWAQKNYGAVIMPTLEADDTIGILATTPSNTQCIVVSEDKDLQTIPCTLYRQGELKTISPEEAEYYWMFQTLTGDATDGYSGCPGIGPKTAEKLLATKPYWNNVVNAYRRAGLTEEDAVMNARLARILQHGEYNETTKEVKLWNPSKIT